MKTLSTLLLLLTIFVAVGCDTDDPPPAKEPPAPPTQIPAPQA
jgi:hypothetical protein